MPNTTSTQPPDVRAVSEQLRLFLILLVSLLLVTQLELPFRLAGILLGVVTIWLGVRLLVRMTRLRRTGVRPRGAITASVGLGLSGVLVATLLSEAAYYPMFSDLETCRSEANTGTAQQACDKAARDRINRLLEQLRNRETP